MIYLTSDLHFNHLNILTFCSRPWASLEEMNWGLVDNWNSVVGPNDTVYLLGDACMGERSQSLQYLAQLQGHIIWVFGNHDFAHPMYKHKNFYEKWREIYSQYATLAEPQVELDEFLLCHFPYWDVSRHDGRYSAWLPDKVDNRWLLHGHIHATQAWDLERPHCYDVGVDSHEYLPVSIDQIREEIKLYEEIEQRCLKS